MGRLLELIKYLFASKLNTLTLSCTHSSAAERMLVTSKKWSQGKACHGAQFTIEKDYISTFLLNR